MIVDNLYYNIEKGKKGLNKGLSTGLSKLDSLTYGIQRGWMTLYGGDSGSGKSSLCLYTTVFKPFQEYLKNENLNIHWLLFSFEMSAEVVFAKLLSTYLYEEYGRIISYDQILSLKESLSDEDFDLINTAKSWLIKLEHRCTIIDKPTNSDGLYAICKEWAKKFGEFKQVDNHKENYIPEDSEQYLITIIDHIKLLSVPSGSTPKQEIDKACDYLIYFRNKCNFCVNIVQQLNRNFKSMSRRIESGGAYNGIQLDDFSDSSGPVQASEIVLAIFYPFREKLPKYEGYDVRILKDRLRILTILKNRFGLADKCLGVGFYGENSIWKELPKPSDITNYDKYINL